MTDLKQMHAIEDLMARYNHALDRQDLRAWADCFGAQCSYVCTTRENEQRGLPLAQMMDDSRERIEDRITYITKVWAGTFEAYDTRHFVQRPLVLDVTGDAVRTETVFLVTYGAASGRTEVLATGVYLDEIDCSGERAVLRSRKAVLDNATLPRYLVYPV